MDFATALQHLKAGHEMRRATWPKDTRISVSDYDAFVTMTHVTGSWKVWVPSSEDLFAEDWEWYMPEQVSLPTPSF